MPICNRILFCVFVHTIAFSEGLPMMPWLELGMNPATNLPYVATLPFGEETGGSCDAGTMQSPIEILQCIDNEKLPFELRFNGHGDVRPEGFSIKNVGNTAQITFNGVPPTLSGGPLSGEYTLLQTHFHWGLEDDLGSEHAVFGKFGSLESHLVHYKTEYQNMSEAVLHPDGIAVVALLFDLAVVPNEEISQLIDGLDSIKFYQNEAHLASTAMTWLQQYTTNFSYYYYSGSLTTTPCTEVVTWVVLRKNSAIAREQLAEFRTLFVPDGVTPILENRREVQNLNSRSVFCANKFEFH